VPDDAPPRGCGWFDSSHELQRGLVVVEIPVRWVVSGNSLRAQRLRGT
jgi:hypothetical protein